MIKTAVNKAIDRIKASSFVKGVLTLSAGAILSKAVSFFSMPAISRIYAPEIIGDFATVTSMVSIFSVVVTLGLMSAIMVPKTDDMARAICKLIAVSVLLLMTASLILLLLIADAFRIFETDVDYNVACIFLYILGILTNISSVIYAYTNRLKKYKVLFWNPSIGTISNAGISIALGLLGWGLIGYALGNVISAILVIVHMLVHVNPFSKTLGPTPPFKEVLKKYRKFPLFQMPANAVGAIANQLPVQLIGRLFGSSALGAYSMCLSILGLPIQLIASQVNRVYYQEASSRYNEGKDIGAFSFKLLKANIKIAFIPMSLFIIFGEPLFIWFLGPEWALSGAFTAILGEYQMVRFCNQCLSGNFVIIEKQYINLLFAFLNVVLTSLAFIVGYLIFKDIYATLLCYAISGTVFSLFDTGLFLHLTGVKMKTYISFIVIYIALPVLVALVLRWCLSLLVS